MNDDVPTAKAIELVPKNTFAKLLNSAMTKEWFRRFGVKLSTPVAAAAAGFFAAHGGQQYAEAIGTGLAALALFCWEAGWSWVQHKVNVVRIVEANQMDTPTSRQTAVVAAQKVVTAAKK